MIEINFHTHHLERDHTIQIVNYLAHNLPVNESNILYSTGIHPWHIHSTVIDECIDSMEEALTQSNVIAVGECGLDHAINTDFPSQMQVFKLQIELAQKYSKPLIIHCVRAYPELIMLKKQYKKRLPWIIHGFQGNHQTMSELVKHDFYFSVGEELLNNPQHAESLSMIAPDHLFFETDDRDTSISYIYSLAARTLNMETDTLRELIFDNFNQLFGTNEAVINKINSLKKYSGLA